MFVTIGNDNEWKKLVAGPTQIVAEMMLAKKAHLLTPALKYGVQGVEENKMYFARLQFQRVSNFTFKWHEGLDRFVEQQAVEPEEFVAYVDHIAGPQPGSFWAREGLDFSWVKITNKPEMVTESHVHLQSKMMYQPVIYLQELDDWQSGICARFEEQAFAVVTSYHNAKFVAVKKELLGVRGGGRKRKANEDGAPVEKRQKKKKVSGNKRLQEIEEASEEELEAQLQAAMEELEKAGEPVYASRSPQGRYGSQR